MVHSRGFVLSVCCVVGAVIINRPTNAQTTVIFHNSSSSPISSIVSVEKTEEHTSPTALSSSSSSSHAGWARFASGTGNLAFLAVGTLLPLVEDGKVGKDRTLRVADSLLTSALITEGLKTVTHKKRPDGSDYKSFPSGHATAAFAVASMQAHFHPKQALFWYAGATLIAASRVNLRRHYVEDVVAGAAVGYITTKIELKQRRGLLLSPFISSSGGREHVGGLSLAGAF